MNSRVRAAAAALCALFLLLALSRCDTIASGLALGAAAVTGDHNIIGTDPPPPALAR